MGNIARARRRPARRIAFLCTLVLLAVIGVGVTPHARQATAAPNGASDPPAPPPLPWPVTQPIVDSDEVGYLPGSGTVTAAGDYQYTMPIDVPDGRAGMAPEITLRYSSRGGSTANGLAGVGWSIQYGGSEINRCAKTFLHDGEVDTPNFALNDALCLDGQRLVQVNEAAPMSEDAEYRTFRDSFTKIVAHAGGQEAAGWFEVLGKDGRIRVYVPLTAKRWPVSLAALPNGEPGSGGPPAEVTAAWVLAQERDRAGNAILYTYESEPDSDPPHALDHRISTIEYTAKVDASGKVQEAPRRKVVFEYSLPKERPDQLFHYQGGVRRSVSRRLSRIKLYAPNPVIEDLIGQYAFTYEADQERSFLSAVQRLDDSGWRRMWERSFEWAHDDRPHFVVVDPPALAGTFHPTQPLLFDADNDGKEELLVDGKFCRTTAGSLAPFNSCVSGAATAGIWGRPADVNGDGKVDVLRQTPAGVAFATWSSATGSFEPLDYGAAPNSNLIDADGDGLIDAFVVGPRVNPLVDYYDHEWYLRLNTGSGFAAPVAPSLAAPFKYGRKSAAIDLDGNGRGELHTGFHPSDEPPSECAQSPSPPWEYSGLGLTDSGALVSNVALPQGSGCRKVLIDLNGDGLRDLLVVKGPDSSVRYNTGTRFLPAEPFDMNVQVYPRLGRHSFEVGDVDGDGLEDLISSNEASSLDGQDHLPNTHLFLRRHNGFAAMNLGASPYEIPAYDPEDFPPHHEDQSPVVKVGDVNGDGLADLVVVIRDRSEDTSKVRVLLQQWEPHDLVVRVWDEHGTEPRESVFYSPFTAEEPSPSACAYPSRCLRGGMVVAREHWIHRQEAPSAIRRTAYEFDDARMDVRGRGMLGFGQVRTVDLDSFAETISLFDHATADDGLYPFAGMPRDVWRITPILKTSPDPAGGVLLPGPGGEITARVSHTHHDHERRATNEGLTHAVFETGSHTEEWEQHVALQAEGLKLLDDGKATAPRVRHTSRQLDDFGSELFSATWTEGGQRCETTTVPQNDTATWLIGLPQSTAVTCNQDGSPLPEARLQTMEHDSRGLLAKVTVEPNHPELSTVTTYKRNSDGLVTRVMVTAKGELPRKTFLAYDEEGVYPRATWNALGHYQQQIVHPAYGVPVLAQDPNGIQAHYRYDGFGRVREIDPDDATAKLVSYQQDPALPWALRVEETRSDGGASRVLTDEHGRTLATAHIGFDGQWIHERSGYNRFGQRTEDYRPAIGQPPSIKTVTTYDTLGRAVAITEPNGAITTVAHSMFEAITTDPEGRQSKVVKDADDRVVLTADLHEGQWVGMTYQYGPFSQLDQAVDPAGNVVHTAFDKLGRRVALDDPDRGLATWTYTAFGEIDTETDAFGDTTLFDRDVLGRLTSTAHDLNGITTLTYDGAGAPGEIGRLTAAASPDGVTTTYEYDPLGRNVRTFWAVGAEAYDVVRTYDDDSRVETIRYPIAPGRDPFVAQYAYNPHGFLETVHDGTDPADPKPMWEVASRNEDGLLRESTSGNGVAETRQYDPATGRLSHIEAVKDGAALYAVHYTRDLTGNIRVRDDYAKAAPRHEAFDYDELDRLASWKVRAGGEKRDTAYGYDLLGNVETITRGAAVETHAHDGQLQNGVLALPHALTGRTFGGQTTPYGYDGRGRQLHGGGREITWKPFDLPATVAHAGQVTTFTYDAFGVRVRKVRKASGVLVAGVDTIGGLYERRFQPSSPTRHVFYVRGGEDGPVAQVVYAEAAAEPEQTLYLHREALGSVGLVTDNLGGELERTYFDPFGEKADVFGDVTFPLLGDVKLGFTGHRHDDELALIDMRGRVYDPAQKRFLSPDPHVPDPLSGQSYNRYAYVVNNPLRYTDPTGFLPAAGDLKHKGGSSQPDGGAAAPAPNWPRELRAPWTVVTPKADDTDDTSPPPPLTWAQQEAKWAELIKRFSWGAGKQLLSSLPPVALGRQIYHNAQVTRAAVSHAWEGDWDLAGAAILEMPQQNAEALVGIVTGPIEAALSIPGGAQTAIDSEMDPESRGEAAVATAQAIAATAAALAGAAGRVKGLTRPTKIQASGAPQGARRASLAQRDAVFEKSKDATGVPRCEYCGTEITRAPGKTNSFEADHKTPYSRGGPTANGNLTGACRTCNRQKGAKTAEEFKGR